jgi:hypothetical protein
MKIRVTDTAGDEFDQYLSGAGYGDGYVLDNKPRTELVNYCCMHR